MTFRVVCAVRSMTKAVADFEPGHCTLALKSDGCTLQTCVVPAVLVLQQSNLHEDAALPACKLFQSHHVILPDSCTTPAVS